MATLEKIRKKSVLLLVIIGAALIAFIIGDFLNSGSAFFGDGNYSGKSRRQEHRLYAIPATLCTNG